LLEVLHATGLGLCSPPSTLFSQENQQLECEVSEEGMARNVCTSLSHPAHHARATDRCMAWVALGWPPPAERTTPCGIRHTRWPELDQRDTATQIFLTTATP